MGRPKLDVNQYKDVILDWYREDLGAEDIVKRLQEEYQFKVTGRTIKSRLAEWQQNKRIATIDSHQLRLRVSVLFFQWCLNDRDILRVLQREGHQRGFIGLVRLRKEMGIDRRVAPDNRREADAELLSMVQKELDKGTIDGYGKSSLYAHFRTMGITVSR